MEPSPVEPGLHGHRSVSWGVVCGPLLISGLSLANLEKFGLGLGGSASPFLAMIKKGEGHGHPCR